ESDSTIPDPSHQTITSTPPVIAPVIDFSSPKPSSQVTTPPITTEATSITTTLLEITSFIALQLRVAKLEQDMSESLSRIKNLKRVRKRLSDSKGNGQRMTRGGAKTSSQRSRKDYRSGGSFEVWKALLEEE
ncbi:hypothetical protein Tco_0806449, partial [Tanacetum coccineum]